VRFDDRVTGNVKKFCEHGTIVQVDIDASEINKNKPTHLAVISDVKFALARLVALLRQRPLQKRFGKWHQQIAAWKAKAPLKYTVTDEVLHSQHVKEFMGGETDQIIMPQYVIELLYELTHGEAIITTGVGQHQMWSGQYYQFTQPRQFITSGGLGAMGFGFPAALGIKVARPDKQVVDIDGDGSFLMNVQELATAHIEQIAAKAIILNNQHLGMVMQWEDKFYGGNRGHTYLGDPKNMKQIYPDFIAMAKSFNVKAERVIHKRDLRAALQRMLDADEPYLLDVTTPYSEHVLPFIPAGKDVAEMIYEH
jgi:acetolactate synthase-1/2/3 large subunit